MQINTVSPSTDSPWVCLLRQDVSKPNVRVIKPLLHPLQSLRSAHRRIFDRIFFLLWLRNEDICLWAGTLILFHVQWWAPSHQLSYQTLATSEKASYTRKTLAILSELDSPRNCARPGVGRILHCHMFVNNQWMWKDSTTASLETSRFT